MSCEIIISSLLDFISERSLAKDQQNKNMGYFYRLSQQWFKLADYSCSLFVGRNQNSSSFRIKVAFSLPSSYPSVHRCFTDTCLICYLLYRHTTTPHPHQACAKFVSVRLAYMSSIHGKPESKIYMNFNMKAQCFGQGQERKSGRACEFNL